MAINKDFFINKKECSLIVNDGETLNLFFGAEGRGYFTINDVKIIPNNCQVNIIFEMKDKVFFDITIDEAIDIYQKQITIFDFELVVGENKYDKYQCYEGTLKIRGNCTVVQKPSQFIDL